MSKHFILTGPSNVEATHLEYLGNEADFAWREKARQLQLRRWRKIKHQV